MVDFASKLQRRKITPVCEVCGEPQQETRSGLVCKNGHGGADTVEVAVTEEPLHLKYRPHVLKDVWGQDHVTKSLEEVVRSKNPAHAYLFTGPAGTGKTTLARILAAEFHCDPNNILEADAATNNGIDSMREITTALRYHGFGDQPNKAIIIDECHALSKQAWQSLLKTVEEPPPHVFIFFCTTESGKVPKTIETRCHNYVLKPLRYDDLYDLLDMVDEKEGLKTPGKMIELVARAAAGSARQALVMLSMVRGCKTVEEAEALLETPLDNKEVIDLCRLAVDRKLTWDKVISTLQAIPDMNPESVRIVAVNYLAACLMTAKGEKNVTDLLWKLSLFSKPFNPTDKMAPLLLAFGNIVYPE